MTTQTIYRINFVGRVVKCGYLEKIKSKYFLNIDRKTISKYILPEEMNSYIAASSFTELEKYIHKEKGNRLFLNDFQRRLKRKKTVRKLKGNKNKESLSKKIKEDVKKMKERILIDEENKKKEKQATIKHILKTSKTKIKLKYDLGIENESLGTLGDFFNDVELLEEPKEQDYNYNYNYNYEEELIEPLKKPLSTTKQKQKHEVFDTLVLWDIENVNFYNDFSIISRIIPKESYKVFSYSKKNSKKKIYLKGDNLSFVLSRLKKRGWLEKRTTKIADSELIEDFHQRKHKIKNLVLISADRDFEEICKEAIQLGITVFIMNNENRQKYSWFSHKPYKYQYINTETMEVDIFK